MFHSHDFYLYKKKYPLTHPNGNSIGSASLRDINLPLKSFILFLSIKNYISLNFIFSLYVLG